MRIVVVLLAVIVAGTAAGHVSILVLPSQVRAFAKEHHCQPVTEFVLDEDSSEAAPYDFGYEFDHDPPAAQFAACCKKEGAQAKGTYTLLIGAERPDNPLHSCPDEIPNVSRIGRPSIEAAPMVPHDFVIIDTGERLTVRELRIMFGVRNSLPWGKDFFACVAGRWARYTPEH